MTPPLIMLLNAVMAENQRHIEEALSALLDTLRKCATKDPQKRVGTVSLNGSLDEIVERILDICPHLATVAEETGGCLPLHVASSLGDIKVVKILISKVN